MAMLRANTSAGFVLPVVLGIILITALLAMQSATELGTQTLLASQRVLHQRAFEAGESGIEAAMEQLRRLSPLPARQQLQSAHFPSDGAVVESRIVAQMFLPTGYSAGRVLEVHHEIRSTGHSARGASVTVVQGVRQLVVAKP